MRKNPEITPLKNRSGISLVWTSNLPPLSVNLDDLWIMNEGCLVGFWSLFMNI